MHQKSTLSNLSRNNWWNILSEQQTVRQRTSLSSICSFYCCVFSYASFILIIFSIHLFCWYVILEHSYFSFLILSSSPSSPKLGDFNVSVGLYCWRILSKNATTEIDEFFKVFINRFYICYIMDIIVIDNHGYFSSFSFV